ncbi:DUF378 domain-containing protein [Sporosarcina limicola]|uniref:Uncharacterized membrane protein YuzA (DUF378 family) n=1 Tax=Sporosarcina limicola TaxID=34101 RepID=A0A927MS68_9BACL|nr:DUF378 domain-containing protein [Sporosarcina limicola]MBE1556391.1 uncharacterized membrane protein YuzA (DUF378 family) [Sporosarcina limicola]
MNKVHKIALAITIIGALNWGVAGIFRFDVVAQMAGGSAEPLARFVYLVIGISGLFNLGILFKNWREEEKVRIPRPKEA